MAEKCCDTATMNCEKLIGIGPNFSVNDTLYYRLELDAKNEQVNLILSKKLNS